MKDFFKLFLSWTAADLVNSRKIKDWHRLFCFAAVLAISEVSYSLGGQLVGESESKFSQIFDLISGGLLLLGIFVSYFRSSSKRDFFENFFVFVFALTIEYKLIGYYLLGLAVMLVGSQFLIDKAALDFILNLAFVVMQLAVVVRLYSIFGKIKPVS